MMLFKNWYLFVFPGTRILSERPRIARLRNGTVFRMGGTNSTTYRVMVDILWNDEYRLGAIRDPRCIVDLGANVGVFALTVAKRFPNAHIYAVEPVPETFAQLVENIRLSGVTNVTPLQNAVAHTYGTRTLYLGESSVEHTLFPSLLGDHGNPSHHITVETLPLSHFGTCDVLKVDVEGAEYELFEDTIPDCDYLMMDVHRIEGTAMNAFLQRFEKQYHIDPQPEDIAQDATNAEFRFTKKAPEPTTDESLPRHDMQ